MATNQLLPFANGAGANVETYANWSALPQVGTGFGSGLAVSKHFNYILAQGGAAGYAIGKVVVDWLGQDATIDATTLGTNFEAALDARFTLPTASASTKGGVKVGSTLEISSDVLNQKSGVATAGTAGTNSDTSGLSLAIPYLNIDTYGRVTGYGTHTHTVSGLPTIVASGTNYRKWSTGWIEQWGNANLRHHVSDVNATTVTFPTAFTSDTTYSIVMTPILSSLDSSPVSFFAIKTSGTTVTLRVGAPSSTVSWYAVGY